MELPEIMRLRRTQDGSQKFAAADIPVNEANFPDNAFRNHIKSRFGGTLSADEIASTAWIDVSYEGNIRSLKGIEYFTALKTLDCVGNLLTKLDVSGCAALEYLECDDNKLTTLDVSGCTALEEIRCGNNKLTTLNASGCVALNDIDCFKNKLTTLDVSDCVALEEIYCYDNQLKTLDVSDCAALKWLYCGKNKLTSLDVSNNTMLDIFFCSNNQLTSLNVSGNTVIKWLDCAHNKLTSLDVSNITNLRKLECNNNQLTSLDVSNNKDIEELSCHNNYIADTETLIALASEHGYKWKVLPQKEPKLYDLKIKLNGGDGGAAGGKYIAGTAVSINAGTREGFTFNRWTSSNGGSFKDARSASTSFIMPDADTTISANWTGATPTAEDLLIPDHLTMGAGVTVQPNNLLPYGFAGAVSWQSDDEAVLKIVKKGKKINLRAVKAGSTQLTATFADSGSVTIPVKVVPRKQAVSGVSGMGKTTLGLGESKQLEPKLKPASALDKAIFWHSSNEKVATVKDGLITANGSGTCRVVAVLSSGVRKVIKVNAPRKVIK